MGLNRDAAKLFVSLLAQGHRFSSVLTLGRLACRVDASDLRSLLVEYGCQAPRPDAFQAGQRTSEDFFKALGADEIRSLDMSNYQGASLTHDLNVPIGNDWRNRFDVVFDGGTLEHVFHFTTGLKCAMEMVRPGGLLVLNTPANNMMGHGFYCLSPELFYRALSPENGFEVRRMLLIESYARSPWWEVQDPAAVGQRVELTSDRQRAMLLIAAQKTADVPIFASTPQQSDYSAAWKAKAAGGRPGDLSGQHVKRRFSLSRVLAALAQPLADAISPTWSAALRNRRSISLQAQPQSFTRVTK